MLLFGAPVQQQADGLQMAIRSRQEERGPAILHGESGWEACRGEGTCQTRGGKRGELEKGLVRSQRNHSHRRTRGDTPPEYTLCVHLTERTILWHMARARVSFNSVNKAPRRQAGAPMPMAPPMQTQRAPSAHPHHLNATTHITAITPLPPHAR